MSADRGRTAYIWKGALNTKNVILLKIDAYLVLLTVSIDIYCMRFLYCWSIDEWKDVFPHRGGEFLEEYVNDLIKVGLEYS